MSPASINYKSRLVYRCYGDQSARQRDRRARSSPCRHEMSRYGARERRRRVRRWRNFELRALWFNLLPDEVGLAIAPGYPLLKDASLCVNLDWLFGNLNSVVWFFG